jgi:hypothetical protein
VRLRAGGAGNVRGDLESQSEEEQALVMVVSMVVVGLRGLRGFRGLGHLFALPPGICAREAGRQQKEQGIVLGGQVGWGVS